MCVGHLCIHIWCLARLRWCETNISHCSPQPIPSLYACVHCAQSCSTLCDPIDCSLPGPSVHGTFQARIMEYVANSYSTQFIWEEAKKGSWMWNYLNCMPFNSVLATHQAMQGSFRRTSVAIEIYLQEWTPSFHSHAGCLSSYTIHQVHSGAAQEWWRETDMSILKVRMYIKIEMVPDSFLDISYRKWLARIGLNQEI